MVVLHYLRLIRLPILILVGLIQYATRHWVIEPMLKLEGFDLIVSDVQFFLIVLSSACIGAGGYAINDYFDVKIDRINKPKSIIVGRLIKRRVAMASHILFTGVGITLAFFASRWIGVWELTSFFILAAFLLWFYSTNLQHTTLAGNLVVALIAGFAPLVVGLYEIPLQNTAHQELFKALDASPLNIIAYWIMGYAACIAVLTLAREITKDVIDAKGDKSYGAKTIPVVLGVKSAKTFIISIYFAFGLLLAYFFSKLFILHLGITYLFTLFVILILVQSILLFRARTKKLFLLSANLNVIMVVLLLGCMYIFKELLRY